MEALLCKAPPLKLLAFALPLEATLLKHPKTQPAEEVAYAGSRGTVEEATCMEGPRPRRPIAQSPRPPPALRRSRHQHGQTCLEFLRVWAQLTMQYHLPEATSWRHAKSLTSSQLKPPLLLLWKPSPLAHSTCFLSMATSVLPPRMAPLVSALRREQEVPSTASRRLNPLAPAWRLLANEMAVAPAAPSTSAVRRALC